MLSQRLSRLALDPQAPFLTGFAGLGNVFGNDINYAVQFAQTEPDKIVAATEVLVVEARRVGEHGFTESELQRAKQSLLRSYQQAYDDAGDPCIQGL